MPARDEIAARPTGPARPSPAALGTLVVLAACVGWAYWPVLGGMVHKWSTDPHYSHGFLVPLFAGALLWMRRARLTTAASATRPAWSLGLGLALVVAGAALRLAGAYYFVQWFAGLSLLPTLAGLALLVGGLSALRWSLPAIVFLFFMIPLPYRVERLMGSPLQGLATRASTYGLQTMGLPAVYEGNVILLHEHRIGVVEACNGLGVMFTFLAFTVGTVLVIRRPLLDKAIILLSAAPFAMLANVTRITVTGLLHQVAGSKIADLVFHDLAGWLMMPMTLALLWLELALLSLLLVEPAPADVHGRTPVLPAGLPLGGPIPTRNAAPGRQA